jgi:hypothetical protein
MSMSPAPSSIAVAARRPEPYRAFISAQSSLMIVEDAPVVGEDRLVVLDLRDDLVVVLDERSISSPTSWISRIEPISRPARGSAAMPPAASASSSRSTRRAAGACACSWLAGMRYRRSISFSIASSRVRLERMSAITSSMSHTA